MKIIIAPDSFKNSLDSERICRIVSHAAKRVFPDAEIVEMPLCDGGEGTAAILVRAMDGRMEKIEAEGPFGKKVKVSVGFANGGRTAIIESAQAVGHHYSGNRANVLKASSFGIGEMISYATAHGAREVIITLGGSCTNDCGAGMLSAMGVSFIDIMGNRFVPTGGSLERVEAISYDQRFAKYSDITFKIMCDVTNPLLGENGCAVVYSPQKGANEQNVKRLENGDKKFSDVVRRVTGKDMRNEPGAGAAGGIGYGAMSFLGAKTYSGIEMVLSLYDFENAARDADLVITGEGSFDRQSLMGKAVGGILQKSGNVPVAVVCGITDGTDAGKGNTVIELGKGLTVEESIANAPDLLRDKIEAYFETLK